MKYLTLTLAIIVSACSSDTKDINDRFIGKWILIKASITMPDECKHNYMVFNDEGDFISSDGYLTSKSKYVIEPYNDGYLVKAKLISMEGNENCQGVPVDVVKENTVFTSYIEFKDNTLYMYVGEKKGNFYFIYEK